jgi:hypothetical protein
MLATTGREATNHTSFTEVHRVIPQKRNEVSTNSWRRNFAGNGGGDRTRTCIAFRPAVFKTAALPLCDPSAVRK